MLLLCSFTKSNKSSRGGAPGGGLGGGMEPPSLRGHFSKMSKSLRKFVFCGDMTLPTTLKFLSQSVLLMTSIFRKGMSFSTFLSIM